MNYENEVEKTVVSKDEAEVFIWCIVVCDENIYQIRRLSLGKAVK